MVQKIPHHSNLIFGVEDLPTRCRAKTQDSMAEESVCCRFDQNSSGLRIVERRLRAFVTAS